LVFITSSRELDARVRQLIAKTGPELRRAIPVDMTAEVSPEGKLVIGGSVERPDGTVIPVSCRPEAHLAPAESSPLPAETIARQLEKSGGTPFFVRSLALEYDGSRFAPLATINRLRREFFAAATEQLAASFRPPMSGVRRVQRRWQEETARIAENGTCRGAETIRLGIYADTLESVKEAAAAGIETIFFEPDLVCHPDACGRKGRIISPLPLLEEAIGICREKNVMPVWKFPRITHDRYLAAVTGDIQALAAAGLAGCMVENPGTAHAIRAASATIPIFGSTGLNIFNHAAVMAAAPVFSRVTLSPELSRDEIALLHANLASRNVATECALVVQGTGEVLITEDCLKLLHAPCAREGQKSETPKRFLGIRDDEGQVYPVWSDGACRTRIGNSRELCLIDHLPLFSKLGIREAVIDARHRPAKYTRSMCRIYQKARAEISSPAAPGQCSARLELLRQEIAGIALGGITPGHFLRGLKE